MLVDQDKECNKDTITCVDCDGTGKVFIPYSENDEYEECRICHGEGQVER